MKFYSPVGWNRPVRLCEETRLFAQESLGGRYGKEALKTLAVSLDDVEGFADLPPARQYALAILRIAEQCPLIFPEHCLLAGGATLGMAIDHQVPATYRGKPVFRSISHTTLGFGRALKLGLRSYEEQIRDRLAGGNLEESQRDVLEGMAASLQALRVYCARLRVSLNALRPTAPVHVSAILANLEICPWEPPQTFYQAVQSLWLMFSFCRLAGNWPGLGRVDQMLGPYLARDLRRGEINLDQAREILAHFFIKGCEWITLQKTQSGDAQHYQNIVLAGTDENGGEVANEVTRLILEVVEELPIGDFPIAVRMNRNSPGWLVDLTARVIAFGGGVVAVYNEEKVIQSLEKFGYPARVARRFANDGCWEVQIPGETSFMYYPFDGYYLLQTEVLGLDGRSVPEYACFEEVYDAWLHALERFLCALQETELDRGFEDGRPCCVVDLFEEDCIGRGRGYLSGGPRYRVYAPHLGGFADIVNSLYAISKWVYEEKRFRFSELMQMVRENWNGHELVMRMLRNDGGYFGNDNPACDALAARLLRDYARLACRKAESGVLHPPGISTFGRQIAWKDERFAHVHGHRRGEVLANNTGPTPSSDRAGVTALLRSYCSLPLELLPNGAALEVKLSATVLGEEADAPEILGSLLRGFVELGGYFLQLDIADDSVLRDAQEHPERYENLCVRVSGWSARFVTLSREWQQMILERTTQKR